MTLKTGTNAAYFLCGKPTANVSLAANTRASHFPFLIYKLKKYMLNKKHLFKFAENPTMLASNSRNKMLPVNLPLSP